MNIAQTKLARFSVVKVGSDSAIRRYRGGGNHLVCPEADHRSLTKRLCSNPVDSRRELGAEGLVEETVEMLVFKPSP